jgi:2-dehydro-3-deoxyphosphogluconate aldolase/(4S)-4-hydroxy-2-oxoglutarate aldolase
LSQPSAAEAIRRIKSEVPGACLAAGTVLTKEQLKAAADAGAEACVAPGFDPAIVNAAKEMGMPFCPGVATASELSQALSCGLKMVKFFPAESAGGVKMIKNLLGAFRFTGVKFMPTGGVNLSNVAEYLAVPEIVACGGTWIVPKDALAAGDWAAIEKLASDASALVRSMRAAQ